MKNILSTLVFTIIITFSSFSQNFVYLYNGEYRYTPGNAEPDSSWYKPDFDDSNSAIWTEGRWDIGYGDVSDTGTKIDKVPSLYLRIRFNVSNKDSFKAANFFPDFDDGFVAYLNGVEIARVNLGNPGEKVAYNRLADRSHETVFNRNYFHPRGYYIDSTILKNCVVNGQNILAVQVNNDSINGSDLMFNSILFNITYEPYNVYNYTSYFIRQEQIKSSKFPIIFINTGEYGLSEPGTKYIAHMGIINNGVGKINNATDIFTDYNGRISINIRGKISNDVLKQSYSIETQDASGNNNNVKLLGMPKDNDWILYGPFLDKSLFRNELGFILGRKLGCYEPRTRYCELIYNGEYLGLYILMERIKRDGTRVNIISMDSLDIYGIPLTGGYIVKFDKDRGEGVVDIVYPKDPTPEQTAYIKNYLKSFYNVLNSPLMLNDTIGYKKYIDEKSLLDYLIANETSKNCDAYKFSTYFYKDRDVYDGRLKYGPLWDLDLGFGNSPWQEGYSYEGWQFHLLTNRSLNIHKILRDTNLVYRFADKWFELRKNGFLQTEVMMNTIDSLVEYIGSGVQSNYEVWPLSKINVWSTWGYSTINPSTSYEGDIANLKDWTTKRLQWIDENINKIFYPMPVEINHPSGNGTIDKFEAFPNPFSDRLSVTCDIKNSGLYNFDIVDLSGRTINILKSVRLNSGTIVVDLNNSAISNLKQGLYILSVSKNNTVIHQGKIVKY